MPNLVGIGNSQVPTNAMLGGLAYQDPEHTTLINADIENIAAIKAKINETAVDIFVYNTSLDSDGGVWRKRCHHTSWYNELLGTEKRGTRREFPAIAVLAIFSIMWRWNDFLWPLIVLSKSEVYTLQIGLNAFHGELTSQWNYVLSMTMVTLLPIAIIFAYLQKFITTGIASTGMK